jgi:hypothetical protein
MGLLGSILSLPLRIVNAPIRATENLLSVDEEPQDEDRVFSRPLEELAKEIQRIDD